LLIHSSRFERPTGGRRDRFAIKAAENHESRTTVEVLRGHLSGRGQIWTGVGQPGA